MKREAEKRNTRYAFVILSASEESGQRTESTWKTASFCHSCETCPEQGRRSRNPENQYIESLGGSLKRSLGMALFGGWQPQAQLGDGSFLKVFCVILALMFIAAGCNKKEAETPQQAPAEQDITKLLNSCTSTELKNDEVIRS